MINRQELKTENAELRKQLGEMNEQFKKISLENQYLMEINKEFRRKNDQLSEELKRYKSFGSSQEMQRMIESSQEILKSSDSSQEIRRKKGKQKQVESSCDENDKKDAKKRARVCLIS